MSERALEKFRLRPYRPGDEVSINQGFNEIFGLSRPLAEWYWKFQPDQDGCRIIVAVDERDQVLTQYAAQCFRVQVDGHTLRAGYIVDVFNLRRPGARQQQLSLKAAREFYRCYGAPERIPLLFGFPGERHLRLGRLRLQYGEPLLVPVWRRAADVRPLWWRRYEVRRQCAPTELAQLWQRAARRYPVCVMRDGAWLQRRYLSRPDHRYQQLAAWRHGRMQAWAVLDVAGDIARWVDLLWDGQDARALVELDNAAAQLAQNAGATRLELWLSGDPAVAEDLLRRGGWELGAHPARLHAVMRSFAPTFDSAQLLRQYYFTMGDSDLV